ncbi:FadR/GntR family transcriptional regulator [Peribacillus frigoritolerans]|uniref:FadR/GntR family transcriptional regulator n=1 Tax=Peribacillus frigoritolerans TaxID=450367 RepID=UPI0024C1956F|nr:FadR/GntR family transcriptional regulator [Peribacillus frigoritolerans]WHX63785.1 FadR/GntR family transcriptional regulator [Peribacillus frigoritolerans]
MFSINFNPVSSKKLYVQIYNQILSSILSGEFKIGDKLPAERELCEQFGVSRAPVRQALSALELNGFIYSRQGEGVYIQNNQPQSEDSKSDHVLDSISPEDIIDARMNIEPLIIKFAAERATDEDIQELHTIINKMEEETNAGVYVPETDEALHFGIAKATHNELFIKIISDIISSMKQQEMWQFIRDRTVTQPDYRDVNFREHQLLIKAIEEHNQEEAVKLMTSHMQNLYNRYWID